MNYLLVKEDVESLITAGKRINIAEVIQTVNDLVADTDPEKVYGIAMGILTQLRHRFGKRGIAFVRLPDGYYGIPQTSEEVEFAMKKYESYMLSTMQHVKILQDYSTSKGILPKSFKNTEIKIPSFAM